MGVGEMGVGKTQEHPVTKRVVCENKPSLTPDNEEKLGMAENGWKFSPNRVWT